MLKSQQKHKAFILHRYPYQEQGFLLKIFTQDQGLLTCIAQYAKRPKSAWYSLLQAFQPLLIECRGQGEVLSLKQAERDGPPTYLAGDALFSGFYLNELLLAFMAPHDPHPALFERYDQVLQSLGQGKDPILLEKALRIFEFSLFEDLGFLPDMSNDDKGESVQPEGLYQLGPHHPPHRLEGGMGERLPTCFTGKDLLALHARQFDVAASLKAAKRFTRVALDFYLPKSKLKTREVFAETLMQSTLH